MSVISLRRHALNAILATILLGSALAATTPDARIKTGTYTNLRLSQITGDLSGYEIRIFYTSEGYRALVQFCEGSAGVAVLVPVDWDGREVRLSFAGHPSGLIRISGTIDGRGLNIRASFDQGGATQVTLKRGPSYWDR